VLVPRTRLWPVPQHVGQSFQTYPAPLGVALWCGRRYRYRTGLTFIVIRIQVRPRPGLALHLATLELRRNPSHSSNPAPVFSETSNTRIPGRTAWMLFRAAAASNPTTVARSIFVIRATSAVLKIVGYLSGLSSPSVTENITTRMSSPRSKLAGQTRFPTFS